MHGYLRGFNVISFAEFLSASILYVGAVKSQARIHGYAYSPEFLLLASISNNNSYPGSFVCSSITKKLTVNVLKFRTLFLYLNKMLFFTAGVHKMLVRIINREDPDQTASSE